jgi:hypothetical protein
MQWWGSLTEQFSKLASDAVRQAADAAGPVAAGMAKAATETMAMQPKAPTAPRKTPTVAKKAKRPATPAGGAKS